MEIIPQMSAFVVAPAETVSLRCRSLARLGSNDMKAATAFTKSRGTRHGRSLFSSGKSA